MDILYTLSNNYNGEELRYSLRSLVNLPHNRVFFVGGCPRWAKNIIHIPTEQTKTKWQNTLDGIITACRDNRLSANFVLMNDDFFILEPIKTPTKELNLYKGTIEAFMDAYSKVQNAPSAYARGMSETGEYCKFLGVTEPKCYELHVPFVFNKKKFLKMMQLKGLEKIACLQKRSLYGNLYLSGGISMPDVKIFARDGFLPPKLGKFLSSDDTGFYILKNFLDHKFPQKSPYEV